MEVIAKPLVLIISTLLFMSFSRCSSNMNMNEESTCRPLLDSTNFSAKIELENSDYVMNARIRNEYLSIFNVKSEEFFIVNLRSQYINKIPLEGGLGGFQDYYDKKIYLPHFGSSYLDIVKDKSQVPFLKQYSNDMFYATDVSVTDENVIISCMNGLFVFNKHTEELLGSYRNEARSYVSQVSFHNDYENRDLYGMGITSSNHDIFYVMKIRYGSDFCDTLFRVLREGRCNLVGNFVKSYKDYLLIEYFDSKLGIILEFLDKDTGRSVHREILGVNVKELILYKNTMLIVADQLQTGGNRFIACFNLDRLEYDWKKKISNSQGGFSAPYKGKMYYNGFRDSTLIIEISTGEMVFVDRKTDIVPIYRYDDCLSGEFIILDGVIYTDINK